MLLGGGVVLLVLGAGVVGEGGAGMVGVGVGDVGIGFSDICSILRSGMMVSERGRSGCDAADFMYR